jgi:protocatechuate 3,4-dioxygenase, beta subunit
VGWDRPPHIHFKITGQGYAELVTQMYFKNDPLNEFDQILQSLKKSDQDKLVVEFKNQATQPHPVGQFNIQIRKIT